MQPFFTAPSRTGAAQSLMGHASTNEGSDGLNKPEITRPESSNCERWHSNTAAAAALLTAHHISCTVLGRLQSFLPQMKAANGALDAKVRNQLACRRS